MTTLKTVSQNDVANVFLVTDDFAETFTYFPSRGGGSTTVTGIVERNTNYGDDELGIAQSEEAFIFVARDPDATGGGIKNPTIGDRIVFADGKEFSYAGEREDEDDDAWTLVYRRESVVQEGGANQRLPQQGR